MASRSLGTLTLDLVAKIGGFTEGLSKADRATQKSMRNIKREFKAAAKVIATVGTAITGATTALVVSTVNQAKALRNLSIVANTTTQDLQKISYAAAAYGVEQDKVGDILKDVNDKVGDFLQTGGGPLKDFFENIAPLVGVTAEQFRNLSGDQALGLFVSSLEKANLSQSDMIFYMESIANDASLLIPLFKENGRQIQEMGRRMEELGLVFTPEQIQQAIEFDKKLKLLKFEFESIGRKIAIELLPEIEDFIDILSDPKTIKAAKELANILVEGFGLAAKVIDAAGEALQFFQFAGPIEPAVKTDSLETLREKLREIDHLLNTDSLQGFLFGLGKRIRLFGDEGIIDFDTREELLAERRKIMSLLVTPIRRNLVDAAGETGDGKPKGKPRAGFAQTEARKEFAELVKSLRSQEEVIEESYDRRLNIILKNTKANSKEQIALIRRLGADFDKEIASTRLGALQRSLETEEETLRRQYQENKDAAIASVFATETEKAEIIKRLDAQLQEDLRKTTAGQLFESLTSEEEQIAASYERRRKIILEAEGKTIQEVQAALAALQEQRDEELKNTAFGRLSEQLMTEEERIAESYEERKRIILESTQATEEEKTELLLRAEEDRQQQLAEIEMARLENTEKMFGALAGIAKTYAGETSGIYKALFAVEKAAAVARSIVAIQTGIAQAAAVPFPANLAAMATVAAETASIVSTIMGTTIRGVAHDGLDSVPTTGTYLLEKGERVTTEKTSAKLDRKLDRIESGEMGQPDVNIKMNNIIDPQFVGDYMGSEQGDAIIDNWVTRNQTKIQRVAGGR